MKMENGCKRLVFQLQLLLSVEEMQKYPFTKMVIEKDLTEEEYKQTMDLLKSLAARYEEEREDGLIDHSSLLFHYAGMLCYKLPVEESLKALYTEGLYVKLAKNLLDFVNT